MPQLDGLRALAISLVLLHHFTTQQALHFIPTGTIGVRLFFVLSGFLITGILLEGKGWVEQGSSGPAHVLRRFYARRMLRIFPAYYFYLLAGLAIGFPTFKLAFPWLATYLYNYYAVRFAVPPAYVDHLWSLAVEEQFYCFWPLLVLCTPRRHLMAAILAVVAVGPLSRCWFAAAGAERYLILTPCCLDTLGMGSLLALVCQDAALRRASFAGWCGRLGLPLTVLWLLGCWFNFKGAPMLIFQDSALSLLCVWSVEIAARGFDGAAGRVLSWTPVSYLGKISYGVYLYHLMAPFVLHKTFFPHLVDGTDTSNLASCAAFVLKCLVSVLLASMSWFLLERPLNNLKRSFLFRPPHNSPAPGDAA